MMSFGTSGTLKYGSVDEFIAYIADVKEETGAGELWYNRIRKYQQGRRRSFPARSCFVDDQQTKRIFSGARNR